MIGFWISAAAMILMVAVVLLQALRQAHAHPQTAMASPDLDVYRDQLAEVDRDLSRGTLSPAEGDRVRLEVQRRMLEADRALSAQRPATPSRLLPVAAAMIVLALAGSVGIYWQLGVPGYPDLPLSQRLANADATYKSRPSQIIAEARQPAFMQPADLDPELAKMLDKLRAALTSRSEDLQGHVLLAQNEASLGNFVAARKAQETVIRLRGAAASAEDLSFLAYVMVRAAGGLVTPEAEKVLIRLLQTDPANGWGRFYSGLMFAEIGRPDRTFALWEPLLRETPADSPWTAPIRGQIADVAAAAGINYTLPDTTTGPDAAAVAAASAMTGADRTAMIKTMVAGLEERLNTAGGTVEEWVKLITSLGVLQETERAKTASAAANRVFVGQPGALAALKAAAVQAGLDP
ncbi:MAG: c-type cytochrome biogenesis protein CcmI [Alphaproteobacteria bacterium]